MTDHPQAVRQFDRKLPRRTWLYWACCAPLSGLLRPASQPWAAAPSLVSSASSGATPLREWLPRWRNYILDDMRSRYCDREMGEEIGWLISPYLRGFYYGYKATRDPSWVKLLVDWADSWLRRGIKEPDGFIGWPKMVSGRIFSESYLADSLLGEAMGLHPMVLMAEEIRVNPALQKEFGRHAEKWLGLAEQIFEKWQSRGCWRTVEAGGLWVEPAFGIDPKTGKWTSGYEKRHTDGFSNPANKQNLIALWVLALHKVTGKAIYRETAESWWRFMRSRMGTREGGKYFVWNYWEPAGPWDYAWPGIPAHWIGVHPNGGYYGIDVESIVAAYENGFVFTRADIDKLIRTNRDFMWNQNVEQASFRRIDGGPADERWKNTPGVLWTALVPHDGTLRRIFLSNHNPGAWNGMWVTPWFLAQEKNGSSSE